MYPSEKAYSVSAAKGECLVTNSIRPSIARVPVSWVRILTWRRKQNQKPLKWAFMTPITKGHDRAVEIFHSIDADGSGELDFEEFTVAYKKINPDVSMVQLQAMFEESDIDGSGTLDLEEFVEMSKMPQVDILGKMSVTNRDDRGLMQVMPSTERYFGEELKKTAPKGVGAFVLSHSQHLAMELYESRFASMQRFVAMTVMFHQMGTRVESFFPKISLGLLGYRMDRTHSIMRIATTASPVSGADVRDRMVELHLRFKVQKAVNVVNRHYRQWKRNSIRKVGSEDETPDPSFDRNLVLDKEDK